MSTVLRSYNLPGRINDVPREIAWIADNRVAAVAIQEGKHITGNDLKFLGPKWSMYACPDPALPILVNKAHAEVVGQFSHRAYKETHVGSWGAGPATLKAGWTHGVELDTDEGRVWFFNNHLAPSVTRPARTKAAKQAREKRRALHMREVTHLVDVTEGFERAVLIGDFNAPPKYAGLNPLARAGYRDIQPGVTHGRAGRIDHAFVRGVRVLGSRVVKGGKSDHNPIEVVLAL